MNGTNVNGYAGKFLTDYTAFNSNPILTYAYLSPISTVFRGNLNKHFRDGVTFGYNKDTITNLENRSIEAKFTVIYYLPQFLAMAKELKDIIDQGLGTISYITKILPGTEITGSIRDSQRRTQYRRGTRIAD